MVVPAEFEGGHWQRLHSPGAILHLTSLYDPDSHSVHSCGEPIAVASPGWYRAWVEIPAESKVSPYSTLIRHSHSPRTNDPKVVALPVGAGGWVIPPAWAPRRAPSFSLRLLAIGPPASDGYLRWEISKRVPWDLAHAGVLMPEGLVLAAAWDERNQRYETLSRPFRVARNERVEAPLRRPDKAADLVVQISRHVSAKTLEASDLHVALERNGDSIEPDVVVPSADRVYAVWYDLRPGAAVLSYLGRDSAVTNESIFLEAGRISRHVTGAFRLD